MIGLSETHIGKEEETAVLQVLHKGWFSQGEITAEFENSFAEFHDIPEAIAVGNCTQGLHLALAASGISDGDEVLVPSVTFIATINAVLYTGATPVPIDNSTIYTPHMSIVEAEKRLTPQTKAIIIMHYAGYRMDIPAWKKFADTHGLLLFEDAAHAPGLESVGKVSHAAIFSFFANKNMTTAEGGMILCHDHSLAQRLRLLRAHGMTATTLTRAQGHAFSYDITELGWNYRIDEIRSAIGLAQLKKLKFFNEKRMELAYIYYNYLKNNDFITLPFSSDHISVHHLFTLLLSPKINRKHVMQNLRENGIQTSIHYPPYHKFSWHRKIFSNVELPKADFWCANTLTLPLHPGLTAQDIRAVVENLQKSCELFKNK